ncbi:ImmA/IrrE family metallo-endopeptidase [Aliarcobacter butzleri]|uniref:ImmA/IrrE family metallo-endopeptidase n=1 Tax=Aliarcobacter butzleri TaxID=28197 RepID=A0AAW6VK91_9BACT|nr:ImmA/IrrE family metallo-endopeptidase [Aliarcobacter butzleri]MDK2042085.1 ImmA/IrrE family metallo-endopeptidase [Aliarcobacter butzleri]MDK2097304.1 ImmA/IrrE family metallo-endopeptidase [Aliarcobacter butzleri]
MTKLKQIQEQILDTQKLISDTKRIKMFDTQNEILDFIIKQDEILLENLLNDEKKVLLELLNKKIPQNFQTAEELVYDTYGTDYIGQIDPLKIAEKLNIRVVSDYNMIDGIGRSEFKGQETVITYKPTNKYRDKFTVAHELGHIFLHFKKGISYCFVDKADENHSNQIFEAARLSFDNTPQIEEEANVFAGELLIPKKMLGKIVEKIPRGKAIKASIIKEFFAVSNDVTRITLTNYGMFNNGTFVNNLELRRW